MTLRPITIDTADRFVGIVIGQAGIGKTSLLRTIPADERACVLSAEAGLLCVRDMVVAKRVEGFEISSFAEMAEAYQLLATNADAKSRYKWVFIDSLTEISARCVEAMVAKYPNKADSMKLWGEYNDKMTQLIKGFRDLSGYNVVFTCLEGIEKDDMNRRFSAPMISGSSLKDRLPSYFDEVLYMTSLKTGEGQEQRVFVTQPYERFQGKDRSGKLNVTEAPNLGAIKAKIMGGN